MNPGLYPSMTAETYHADPADAPSLSASLARILYAQSPLHAWLAHPRLNPNYVREENEKFDLGTAAHSILLEGDGSRIVIVDAADWRTKAAKEQRDEARAAGKLAFLPDQFARVMEMVGAARSFLDTTELAGMLDTGMPEASMFARHEGIWIRCRSDLIAADRRVILDYKTTDRSANPESWARSSLFSLGYDIQAAANLLLNRLTGGAEDAHFVFLVQECAPPYLCSLVGASPSVVETGRRKFDLAVRVWRECLESREWPGYGTQIAWAEVPAWELARVEERELMEAEGCA